MGTSLSSPHTGWQVICLCADWCGTCRDWRAPLEELARAHPDTRFSWVDIEDQSDLVGDLDIETFPTLLIAHGPYARFLGPVLPHPGQAERLLTSLQADPQSFSVSTEAHQLLARLLTAELEPVQTQP